MATRSADSIGTSEVFRAQVPAASHSAVHRFLMATLALWALAALLVSGSGLFAQLPTPLLPIPVALGIFIPVLVYARSEAFRGYIHAADLRNLTLFHVWRVPAALAFFYYGAQGLLPETFVFNAGWGDLIAGVLAPVVVFGLALGGLAYVDRVRRASFVGFHIFSIADFILAVGTGTIFALLNNPLMGTMQQFPMAMIVLFGVPVTGALSLMTLHRLYARRA